MSLGNLYGNILNLIATGTVRIELDSNQIKLTDPVAGSVFLANLASTGDLANYLPLSGGIMSGSIDMGTQNITNIGDIGTSLVRVSNLYATNATVSDLTVDGTLSSIDSVNLDIADPNITLNKGGNDASSNGAGITVDRTTTPLPSIIWDHGTSRWKAGLAGTELTILLAGDVGNQTLAQVLATGNLATGFDINMDGQVLYGNNSTNGQLQLICNSVDVTGSTFGQVLVGKNSVTMEAHLASGNIILDINGGNDTIYITKSGTRKLQFKCSATFPSLRFGSNTNSIYGEFLTDLLSTGQSYYLPDATGTIALTSALANYLPLAGGTMSGSINMGSQQITNVGASGFITIGSLAGTISSTSGALALLAAGSLQLRSTGGQIVCFANLNPNAITYDIGTTALNGQWRALYLDRATGSVNFYDQASALGGTLVSAAISASSKTWTLPNKNGTIAMTSDIPSAPTLDAVLAVGDTGIGHNIEIYEGTATYRIFATSYSAAQVTIGASNSPVIFQLYTDATHPFKVIKQGTSGYVDVDVQNLTTVQRTASFPDASGIFALYSGIPANNNQPLVWDSGNGRWKPGTDVWSNNFSLVSGSFTAQMLLTGALAGNVQIYFPAAGGTLATTANLGSYLALAGGSMSGTIQMVNNNIETIGTLKFNTGGKLANKNTGSISTSGVVLDSILVADSDGAVWHYVAKRTDASGNLRTGTVRSCWNGTSAVQFDDTSTLDIGSTTDLTLAVVANVGASSVELQASAAAGTWNVRITRIQL